MLGSMHFSNLGLFVVSPLLETTPEQFNYSHVLTHAHCIAFCISHVLDDYTCSLGAHPVLHPTHITVRKETINKVDNNGVNDFNFYTRHG